MNRRAVYGPRDGTVLSQQTQHRSDDILDGDLDDVLKARRADGAFWSHFQQHNLPVRVQQILNEIGFYGVYRCGRLVYDCHLITALVERWRSETHTFHFRVGEATITLQDVQIIWALPIDGEPVTGLDLDRTTIEWQDYCLTYLGFRPAATAFKGSRLQTHAIISHIAQVEITYDTPHEIVVQYARAVALLLLGGVMCPDSSGNLIPLLYLTKLEDIVEARNYSWGSAVLAFLYRELCNATNKGKAAIGGALQLLQIWAWSRIIPLCPGLGAERVYMGQVQTDNNRLLPAAPYGATWNSGPSTVYTPQDYYVPQPPQDDYVPQPPQDDWFQTAPYMPSHAQVHLDLGLGINQPYAPEYNISPVPFPSFSAYRDNVESSSAASSSRLHSNSGGDNNDEQNEPIDDMGEQIRRPRRQRHRRNCGTGGHF
ncbi:UNVERIFIED_CONTAM: Serine/threonine-protein phosphatase 7 long form [Sesamum radiatum]|uniref:Serine/threonine-protein phosphatase 7 long form n=1 Tax=Sesamum radiatum TaxID=300843 RepID=A0AAW2PK59_SESRA